MADTPPRPAVGSRRRFLGATSAAFTAASTAPVMAATGEPPAEPAAVPPGGVHVAGSDEIPAVLVGCGGRGGSAMVDAFDAQGGRVKLTAMADLFPERIAAVKRSLGERFQDRMDVPDDRTFSGFDAFRQGIDAVAPGGIAVFATPPAFRAVHFAHAIERGLHVFMEKPVSIDGPSTRRIIELAARADAKKLKVAVGLMCRHCDRRLELVERLRAGEAGELIAFRGYRSHTPIHNLDLAPGPEGMSELLWQIKRFHNFLWASGGIFSDYCVHHVDEVGWMKGSWPVKAEATGGRHFKGKIDDQNFDNYAIEYTFDDGTKFFYGCRVIKDTESKFGVFGQGSKGAFTISERGHSPAKSKIYRGQAMTDASVAWAAEQPEANPYRREWEHLVAAITAGERYNEVVRGAEASLVTAMGRFAAHTGQVITYDDYIKNPQEFAPGVNAFDMKSGPPLISEGGKYPVPRPGLLKDREY